MTTYAVIDNTELNRFEIHVDGHIAFENYERFDGGIAYVLTKVPDELGGRGIGSFLIKYILDDARAKGLKVKPVCPFAQKCIDKRPEYQGGLWHI